MHYVLPEGMFFPAHLGCDLVPTREEPRDVLGAIATDLLAQVEARHRAATRLDDAVRLLSRGARDRAALDSPIEQIHAQLRILRELFESERALIEDLERHLQTVGS